MIVKQELFKNFKTKGSCKTDFDLEFFIQQSKTFSIIHSDKLNNLKLVGPYCLDSLDFLSAMKSNETPTESIFPERVRLSITYAHQLSITTDRVYCALIRTFPMNLSSPFSIKERLFFFFLHVTCHFIQSANTSVN